MTKQSKKEATVSAVMKRSHVNAQGQHPVKIRLTFNRVQKFYAVTIEGKALYMKASDFENLWTKDVRKEQRQIKFQIEKVKAAAINAIYSATKNAPFTFERFEREFLHSESKQGFFQIFQTYLDELFREGRIGTLNSYKNALQAFRSFRKGRDLSPADITPAMLKDFESYMLKPRIIPKRKKPLRAGKNTVAMYMRAIKVIYNVAASENSFLKENYPFATKQNDRGKYKIRTGPGKKAEPLSVEELQAFIKTAPIEGTPEHTAKLIWLFSFYCQGMNLRDVFLLQYQDVKFDAIRYIRRKTRDTEVNDQGMEIPMSEAIKSIILSIGNPGKSPTAYVFDLIEHSPDPVKFDSAIKQGIKLTNLRLERLCEQNNLPRITTYTARHSYANLLKQSGESLEVIRELLGHSDVRTTEAYLNRFDLSRKQKISQKIDAILKVSGL